MVKIAESLISLYKLALPFCDHKKISLNLDISDPSLSLDMEQRALTNLLKPYVQAAITRTPKAGSITLGAKKDGKEIKIFIKDTGEAIPKSKREELSTENISIHSRHGYGTTITISF